MFRARIGFFAVWRLYGLGDCESPIRVVLLRFLLEPSEDPPPLFEVVFVPVVDLVGGWVFRHDGVPLVGVLPLER